MTRTRWIGLILILLSSGISILWGCSMMKTANGGGDFSAVYYGARCLLQHHNPYSVIESDGGCPAKGWECPEDSVQVCQTMTLYVNMPTTLIFLAPFATLQWGHAYALWMAFTVGVFILAAFLMWNLAESYARKVSLLLMCILLANCEMVFGGGNTAGIAVCLCAVAVWCFLRNRFVTAGILCLAISLAIKPHDVGLVWLYFLLTGAPYRKRALQTLLVTVVLGLAAALWVTSVAPHWMQDWHSNLSAISARGGLNEPGQASFSGRKASMVIDLQAAISVFSDDPRIYNPVSYLVCGALLLVWSVRTLRSQFSQRKALLALASVLPFTLLVTYHRPWDAKLLMLAVPACAMLWAEAGLTRWLALLVTSAGVVFTADIPLTIFLILTNNLHLSTAGLPGQLLTVVLMQPTPLILLVMGIFYLWIYLRRDPAEAATAEHGEPGGNTACACAGLSPIQSGKGRSAGSFQAMRPFPTGRE